MGLDQEGCFPIPEVGPDLVHKRESADSDHSLLMELLMAVTMAEAAAMDMDMNKSMAVAMDMAADMDTEQEVPLLASVEVSFMRLLLPAGEPMHRIP